MEGAYDWSKQLTIVVDELDLEILAFGTGKLELARVASLAVDLLNTPRLIRGPARSRLGRVGIHERLDDLELCKPSRTRV